jgi:hypothetical protein
LTDTDRRFTRFLLGGLPEDERRSLELDFLRNDEAFADLLAREDELRFAYAAGTLDREERALFETRYLRSAEDREQLAFAKALLNRAETNARPAAASPWGGRSVVLALAAAMLVFALGSGWLFVQVRRLERDLDATRASIAQMTPAAETARLRDELSRERARRPLLALVLAPGVTRSSATVSRLSLEDVGAGLRLDLSLPPGAPSTSYAITIKDADGKDVWTMRNLSAIGGQVRTSVPPATLFPADYEIVLHGIDATGRSEDLASYYLSVVPR